MGKLWRRFNEQLRQKIAPPLFTTGSTERHRKLYSQVTAQRNYFRGLTPKIRIVVDSYKNLNGTVLEVMRSSATPSFSTEAPHRDAGSRPPNRNARGPTQRELESVTASSRAMEDRMSTEVLTVLQTWFTKCEDCKKGLHELNALKLELDSRQRTVVSLKDRVHRLELGPVKKHASTVEVEVKLERKERKYNSVLEEFERKDAELEETLAGLLSDVPSVIRLVSNVYQILSDVPGIVHGVLELRHEPFSAKNRPHPTPKSDPDLLTL